MTGYELLAELQKLSPEDLELRVRVYTDHGDDDATPVRLTVLPGERVISLPWWD